MKTILITGATGYLGSKLAKHFASNNYNVIGLALNKNEELVKHLNIKYYFLDSNTLDSVFENEKIDIVIHTATLYGRNNEQLAEMIKVNEIFPLEVLNLSIKNNVDAFVNTSTILSKNINSYALTKYHFTDWLTMYANKICAINMKLDHFYGPKDKPVKFIAWIIEQLKNNVAEIDLTEGSQTRDFIYIDDVINAFDCVISNLNKMNRNQCNNFEVGTNVKTSIRTMVTTIKKMMKNNVTKLNFGAKPYRSNEILDYNVNTTALHMLGWQPSVCNVEIGINKILVEEGLL